MDCYKLNEFTYNKIQNVLEGQKTEDSKPEENYYRALYSPATLINDWYEKRTEEQVKPEDSEPNLTEYMHQFRKSCHISVPDRQECFNKTFESRGLGQELLLDHLGHAYYDNYVTTYDLTYNHLVKGICGPFPRRYYRGGYKPSTDLTLVYGNLTNWGLKETVYEKSTAYTRKERVPTTETADEFVHYDWACVKKLNDFPKHKRQKIIY